MSKEIYISSTPHETRLAIVDDEALTEKLAMLGIEEV